jgi:hypothetical protein
MRSGLGICVLSVAVLAASPSWAQSPDEDGPTLAEKETARSMFREGDELYRAGKYTEALDKFAGADEIMGVPTTRLERGRTLMMLRRLLEARDAFIRVGLIPRPPLEAEAQTRARAEAAELAEQLAERIPSLVVEVRGVEEDHPVTVSLDGKQVARAAIRHGVKVDPGKRLVRAEAEGFVTRERLITVEEGQPRVVTMTMRPSGVEAPVARPLPAPRGPQRTEVNDGTAWTVVGWAGLSVGAVGIVQGIVLGVITLDREKQLSEACPNRLCDPSQRGAFDSAQTLAHVTTASFVIGGVGAALGITGLIVGASKDDSDTGSLRWSISPSSVGLTGVF